MSFLGDPPLVKFFLAAFGSDVAALGEAISSLGREFEAGILGQPDFISPPRPIVETTYYDREMGPGLQKIYLSWPKLGPPDWLVKLKLLAMDLEARLAVYREGLPRRQVNLDPCYVFTGGLVLSTGKFAGHRLYLGQRVFGELTLYYRQGFTPLPWTYRDYQDPAVISLLLAMRKAYLTSIRKL